MSMRIRFLGKHWQYIEKMKIFSFLSKPDNQFCMGCEKEEMCKGCIAHGMMYHKHVEQCKWYEMNKNSLEQVFKC